MNGNLLSLAVDVPEHCKADDDEIAVGSVEGGDDAADASTETTKALTDEADLAAVAMDGSEDSSAIDKELQKTENIEEQDQIESKMEMELDDTAAEGGADTEDKEQTSAIGKKKGTRKKRSTNWEEAERILLLDVIKPKVDFVENRSVDAKSIKAKHLAWVHITKQFNGLNFRHRSLEQIKVQWRSMKNVAKREFQQKHPKDNYVEGSNLVEFMEEMQKDSNVLRAQSRTAALVKKENPELDDEDTPLAALPTSTNSSDDNLLMQTSNNVALPSPPLSAAESQPDMPKDAAAASRKRKKPGPQPGYKQKPQPQPQPPPQLITDASNSSKTKRQRTQIVKKEHIVETTSNTSCNALVNDSTATSIEQSPLAMALSAGIENAVSPTIASNNSTHSNLNSSTDMAKLSFSHTNNMNNNVSNNNNNANNSSSSNNNNNNDCSTVGASNHISSLVVDEKYKKQMFDILKRARLAEMDYVRREHEQKLRFAQMEQELKLNYSRQTEDLKLRLMREEHEQRMRQCQIEHEARMRIYASNAPFKRINAKTSTLDVNVNSEANNF